MVIVDGKIVDFLIRRDSSTGYAEFIFTSDYTEELPRFTAICRGNIPDVAPGVPIKVEFQANDMEDIITVDFRKNPVEKITYQYKQAKMNRLVYAGINYNDEQYALKLISQVKGISGRTAQKILDAVDNDISRLPELWNGSDALKNLRGSKRYIALLKESIGPILEQDNLVKKYSRYGIGYPQAGIILSTYGTEAEEKLLKNPYSVLHTAGVGFQAADNMAKDLGFSYLSDKRLRSIILNVLEANEQSGNTAMKEWDFYIRCAAMHRYSAWKDCAIPPYCLLAVMAGMDSVYEERGLIGFASTMEKETDIALRLYNLAQAHTSMGLTENDFKKLDGEYNDGQMAFLKAFDKNSVVVLVGRGGTGKTHSICGAIRLFQKKYPKKGIRLCAPTARAAGVLKEHSGLPSSTIHVMLELAPYGAGREAGKDEDHPLEDGLIIVDEMSMVDTDLMYHLLKAIQPGTKLILSGDPDQLESVGCGSVLRDIINSKTVPVARLTQIMRQNEGSAVIENCGKVLAGDHRLTENDSFRIRQCKTEEEAKAYLLSCCSGDSRNIQILTTTKKGVIGTKAINREFEKREGGGIFFHGSYFMEGDKVIFTKNNYSAGYCNGDIGYITSVSQEVRVLLDDGRGTEVEIDSELAVDMEHADAITIHKSQGSEYNKVYILLPEKPASLLTRNMVNTAISRTKQDVTVIVVGQALRTAVKNIYKRTRVTRLEEKLRNLIGG